MEMREPTQVLERMGSGADGNKNGKEKKKARGTWQRRGKEAEAGPEPGRLALAWHNHLCA